MKFSSLTFTKLTLCFPKNTSEYEDAQSVLTTLKANIDVKHGYFYPDAPRIDKLQDIFNALLVTQRKEINSTSIIVPILSLLHQR